MPVRHLAQGPAAAVPQAPAQQQQDEPGSARTLILAIAIPCGLALVLALAVVWLLLVKRRRSSRSHPVNVQTSSSGSGGTITINISADATTREEPKAEAKGKGHKAAEPNSTSSNIISSNLLSAGWTIVGTSSSAKHADRPSHDDNIVLGVLLGAGSSARVYRGRWRGEDVAVKVLRHTASTAAAVANETALIMSLDHPNVVLAHHVVTWCQNNNNTSSSSNITSFSGSSYSQPNNSQPSNSQPSNSQPSNSQPSNSHLSNSHLSNSGSMNSTQPSQENSNDLGPLSHSSITSTKHSPELPGIAEDLVCVSPKVDQHGLKAFGTLPAKGAAGSMLLPAKARVPLSAGRLMSEASSRQEHVSIGGADVAQTWLVQELCDGGTLHDAVRSGRFICTDGKLDRVKVLCRLHDVAEGMHYVHKRNVIHRDLKASNVLLVTDPWAPYKQTAKLADFGLSCMMHQDRSYWSTLTLGTVSHMAPELLRSGRQSSAADVYSFGVVMWEVAAGVSAFENMHYIEVISKVALKGERPVLAPQVAEIMGQEYVALMEACWAGTPSKRPAFGQVCQRLHAMLVEAGVHGSPAARMSAQALKAAEARKSAEAAAASRCAVGATPSVSYINGSAPPCSHINGASPFSCTNGTLPLSPTNGAMQPAHAGAATPFSQVSGVAPFSGGALSTNNGTMSTTAGGNHGTHGGSFCGTMPAGRVASQNDYSGEFDLH